MSQTTPSVRPVSASTAETLGAMVLAATDLHHGPAVRFRRDGRTVEWSYDELGTAVRDLARGLIALGIAPGDRVCVLGTTRPEWTLADCAILAAGAVNVPIYHTNSAEECRYVLEHSGARAVICEDHEQLAKVEAVRAQCPDLEHVVTMVFAGDVPTIDDLVTRGAAVDASEVDARVAATSPDDVATIVYTSGTTGPPKGCLLTHANCLATLDMYEKRLGLDDSAVIFLFLPLAHVLARLTQMMGFYIGGTLAFWSGDTAGVLDDLAATRPTHVPSVPRVFEKIHTRALAGVEDGGALKRHLFAWALGVGRRARAAAARGGPGPLLRAEHAVADHLVLSKVRGLFGGDLQLAVTGAAPIAADVLEFFNACGVLVLEAYGMTETCAAGTLNTPEAFRFGTVGRPLPGTEVAVADDGEVLLRGPSVFEGYYRDPEATAETFDDGWLRTGDLGALDADGFLRITGRTKDLSITSSGKNISPSNIESALRESRWISQAVVVGDNRSYLVALLTLDAEETPALARELGIPDDVVAMSRDPRVHAALQAEVDAVNGRFARIEQIKRFAVLDHDLTQEAGELTPTLKVKRAVVDERYADEIEGLYAA